MTSNPVVVVGGGLAGALMTVYLSQKGRKVETFEYRSDMRKSQVNGGRSINLALSVRGTTALKAAGILDEVMKIAIPMRGRMVHPVKVNSPDDLSFQPYSPDFEHVCLYSVSRSLLNQKLMDIAEQKFGVPIHFDQKCSAIDLKTKEITFHNTKDGKEVTRKAKTIIGADGAFSAVREAMRKRTDRFEYSQSFIEHGYKELHIPPNPDGTHRMHKEALHIWPRGQFMMIALPNIDGSFTCTLFFPYEGPVSFQSLDTREKVDKFFKENFADVYDLMPNLLDDYYTNPDSSLVTIRCFPWVLNDTVALLGDSAHAIVPFYGQGMNAAFEDCYELSQCIDKHGDDWGKIFSEFQSQRKENADAIAVMALENFVEMRDLVADADFVFGKKVEHLLEEKFPGRYVSRYELISFSTVPYRETQERGAINKKLLAELTKDADRDIDKIDLKFADELIKKYYNK